MEILNDKNPLGILGEYLLNRQFVVAFDEKGNVASLKRDRKALEEMFHLDCAGFALSSCFLSGDLLKKDEGFGIPTAEFLGMIVELSFFSETVAS